MKSEAFFSTLSVVLFLGVGCNITPIKYDNSMLDGPLVNDTSFVDFTFRVSTHPDLPSLDRNQPVIICAHGYTACTYEWEEFRDYAKTDGRVYTSLVLLGAHGRDIEDFEGSTWKQWQAPIMEEYDTLVKLGFKRISLAGSSTGGTLLLEYLSRNAFTDKAVLPEQFFFIDPIVVPSDKLLHIVNVVGPILGNSPQEFTNDKQKRHWYTNRPTSTLAQLNDLCELIRNKLEDGFSLPAGSFAKCYKSKVDDSVDPVTALLIYKGLTDAKGGKIDVEMVESNFHVFTQLAARPQASDADRALQHRVFREMIEKAVAHR
jgi:carboxylesterase